MWGDVFNEVEYLELWVFPARNGVIISGQLGRVA